MRIIGIGDHDGTVVFDHPLSHGEDPTQAGLRYGYRTMRPLTVRRAGSDIELSLSVESSDELPQHRPPERDVDLVLRPDEEPRMHQRVAAYAVVTSTLGLLATEYSDRTGAPGRWGLPGGGIDAGEDPASAVVREILEESNQTVKLGDPVGVVSGHWIGRSPHGQLEDFHAVRLIYAARCAEPTTPEVIDVGGTTESARWVPLADWTTVPWTVSWRDLLGTWLPEEVQSVDRDGAGAD